jgi:ABC-type Fe3+/spermidine/putrescine transport system ATPase subunit
MSDGRIEQIGTPHEIRTAPASDFVASFIETAPGRAPAREPV